MKGAYTLYFWIAVLGVLVCLAVGCEEETKDAAVVTFPLISIETGVYANPS